MQLHKSQIATSFCGCENYKLSASKERRWKSDLKILEKFTNPEVSCLGILGVLGAVLGFLAGQFGRSAKWLCGYLFVFLTHFSPQIEFALRITKPILTISLNVHSVSRFIALPLDELSTLFMPRRHSEWNLAAEMQNKDELLEDIREDTVVNAIPEKGKSVAIPAHPPIANSHDLDSHVHGGRRGCLHKDFMSCDEAQAYNACFKDTIVHLSALLDARNCIEYFPDYCCCQMISRLKHITYSEAAGSMGLYSVQLNYYKLICYVHCLLKVIIYASVDLQI